VPDAATAAAAAAEKSVARGSLVPYVDRFASTRNSIMHTTIDDIHDVSSLGAAEPVVAPSNMFAGSDSTYSVLAAAFRQAMIDGVEPHGVFLRLEAGFDPDAVLPADAEVVRSAIDDEDTTLLAKGLGYTILVATGGPIAIVSAATREQAKAVADGLRERGGIASAPAQAPAEDNPPLGQYL
jgi:Domain of unknown function (DUF5925)